MPASKLINMIKQSSVENSSKVFFKFKWIFFTFNFSYSLAWTSYYTILNIQFSLTTLTFEPAYVILVLIIYTNSYVTVQTSLGICIAARANKILYIYVRNGLLINKSLDL